LNISNCIKGRKLKEIDDFGKEMAFSDEEENLRKLDKEMVKTYHFGGNFKGQTPQLKAERQKSLK